MGIVLARNPLVGMAERFGDHGEGHPGHGQRRTIGVPHSQLMIGRSARNNRLRGGGRIIGYHPDICSDF